MQNRELTRQLQVLKELIRTTRTIESIDVQGHWGRYLCILTAGFLENALKAVYSEFVTGSSSPQSANWAISNLKDILTPKAGRFVEVTASFDKRWGEELTEFLDADAERRRNAINSIMTTRHTLAHGGTTGISVAQVQQYLDSSVEVVEFIEDQCASNTAQ
ncbi:MAG: hypothetical protein IIB17_06020 [Chloroflexi bacterium]|nr:hypothetical protein [Chloroflexota bacterium]